MDNICVLCILNRVSISREFWPPSHFSQKAISVYIFISNIRFMIYSYWVHSFIRLLRKPLLHFCTLGIIYHMIIAEKMGDILCALIIRIALDQISHTWFDWNLVNGCSLLEENSMDKLKAATIFHSLCAKYSSPWKK